MKARKILCPLLSALLILFFASGVLPLRTSAQLLGSIHNLNTGKSYDAIQEAINAANIGDSLYVSNGTYYENVVVNKTVSLIGQNKSNTIIDGSDNENPLLVTADGVSINGFTIQGSGAVLIRAGVYIDHSSDSKISDNVIKNNDYGILISYSGQTSVLNNTLVSNIRGIGLISSTKNIIANNNLSQNTELGIQLLYSPSNHFSRNNVSLCTNYAIELSSCIGNTFLDNRLSSNDYGFHVLSSNNNNFSDNHISYNEHGIYLRSSQDNIFTENNISLNTQGVWLHSSPNNVFLKNCLINNQNSLRLIVSDNNIIYHNNFINTLAETSQRPSCTESVNSWDNGVEGNFWSTYIEIDEDHNGIIDTAYLINEENIDSYPLAANFSEFQIMVGGESYVIDVISNSTISAVEYLYHPSNRTAVLRLQADKAGGKGFCRISVPFSLITPPIVIMLNGNTSLYGNIVDRNNMYVWMYFTYNHLEDIPSIILLQSQHTVMWEFWFWAAIVLISIVMIQYSLIMKYRQTDEEQKKTIQIYQRKLQKHAHEHFDTARALFQGDLQRRQAKIKKFENKYNVKIRPRNSFEDIVRATKLEKKEKKKVTRA